MSAQRRAVVAIHRFAARFCALTGYFRRFDFLS
jgi:hypothetical protein